MRSRPDRPSSSRSAAKPIAWYPARSSRVTVAAAVPPVARTSSTTSTRCPVRAGPGGLEFGLAVLERVLLAEDLARQLAGLADREHADLVLRGDPAGQREPARLDAGDGGEATTDGEGRGEGLAHAAEGDRVGEHRRHVAEEHARLREVGDDRGEALDEGSGGVGHVLNRTGLAGSRRSAVGYAAGVGREARRGLVPCLPSDAGRAGRPRRSPPHVHGGAEDHPLGFTSEAGLFFAVPPEFGGGVDLVRLTPGAAAPHDEGESDPEGDPVRQRHPVGSSGRWSYRAEEGLR